MPGDIPLPQRRTSRLAGYDYGQHGGYFVTICTLNRECLFGQVEDGEVYLTEGGAIAHLEWVRSGRMRSEIVLDEFVVMPNHVHGIVFIVGADGKRTDGGTNHDISGSKVLGQVATDDHVMRKDAGAGGAAGADEAGDVSRGAAGEGGAAGVHRTPLRRPASGDTGVGEATGVGGAAGVHRTPQ